VNFSLGTSPTARSSPLASESLGLVSYGRTHAGVPNQSRISWAKGATTSGGSGIWPRSPVSAIQVSRAARRHNKASRWSACGQAARLTIWYGSVWVSYSFLVRSALGHQGQRQAVELPFGVPPTVRNRWASAIPLTHRERSERPVSVWNTILSVLELLTSLLPAQVTTRIVDRVAAQCAVDCQLGFRMLGSIKPYLEAEA